MRAGKHVLCEKPAARTYPEALEMQKVQHETGMTLNIGVVNLSLIHISGTGGSNLHDGSEFFREGAGKGAGTALQAYRYCGRMQDPAAAP